MTRVGLDLHVVDGIFQGSRTHVIELFSQVIRLCPEIEFYCFLDRVEAFKQAHPEFVQDNVVFVYMPHANPIKRLMYDLPRLQLKYALDLLHTQYIIPLPSFSPTMVTIHDILFEKYPDFFGRFFRFRSQILMRIAAKFSRHVFTVSEFSRKDIAEQYSICPDKISVTYNAVNLDRFYPGDDGYSLLDQYDLKSGRYILTVGRQEPRKNHLTLLRAYKQLGPSAPPLVIVGQKDFGFEQFHQLLEDPFYSGKVIILEKVGDQDLPALYRHCRFFVYPSLAEGFGMPPLEAMASGVPVISANNTALTEVVADAGILVSTENVQELADAMHLLSTNNDICRDYVKKSIRRAQDFSWNQSAMIVAQRYRALFGNKQ